MNRLNALFAETLKKNLKLPAFTDYQGSSYIYEDVAGEVLFLHTLFKNTGIEKGDHIALLGNNSARWGITFIAIVSYGAVVVPILNEFSNENVYHIVHHSDSKLLFIAPNIYKKLEREHLQDPEAIISIDDYSVLHAKTDHSVAYGKTTIPETKEPDPNTISFELFDPENICLISYTSGTSGFTKGVMLPRRSIISNIIFAQEHMPLTSGDTIVSFLPMAHAYGMLFEFLFPFTMGCHITFLTRIPSPQVVTKAFGEVHPRLILSVPLVIEKIYKKRILPALEKPVMKFLLSIPIISAIIESKVNKKLTETFGGNFHEIVIGGAPLSEEVERFFKKIGFHFTVGYGMTECGPLISYEAWDKNPFRSCGKVVDRMQIKIQPANEKETIGEIMVKGDNVMLGYYKYSWKGL